MFDLMSLVAKLSLDKSEYEQGLKDSEADASSLGSKIKSGLGAVAKGTAVAIGAAATAVGMLTKQSVDGYSEYEQLVGGAQKLYGNMGKSLEDYAKDQGKSVSEVKKEWQNLEDAQNIVLNNAKNAYKTAGMDMNTYLDNATSFSASLINSLGGDTKAAAEQTDVAMRAISDNFNTFGGDLENITNAYKGFSKQNYTMLDNLKLGYGGTKEEMQRLIDDANEWGEANGKASNLSIDSFSDVVTAIEQIQEKQNIAGTTAREASTTIQGSLGMLQSAWQNLVTGFADPDADIGQLVEDTVDAGVIALGNLLPAVERALTGIGNGIQKIAPVIAEKLPGIAEQILPSLLNAATSLVNGLVQALPTIIKVIIDVAPNIITTLVNTIINLLPQIIELGVQLIVALANGIADALPDLIPAIVDMVLLIVDTLIDNIDLVIDAGIKLIIGLTQGIVKALPKLVEKAPVLIAKFIATIVTQMPLITRTGIQVVNMLVNGIINTLAMVVKSGAKLVSKVIEGIKGKFADLRAKGGEIVDKIKNGLIQKVDEAKTWGRDLINNFISGLKEKWENLKSTVSDIAGSIKDLLGFSEPKEGPLSNFHTYAPDMMKLFAKGVKDNTSIVQNAVSDAFDFGEDLTPDINTIEGVYGIGESEGNTSTTNITMNIYGAQGQDVKELADIISRKLGREIERSQVVWA